MSCPVNARNAMREIVMDGDMLCSVSNGAGEGGIKATSCLLKG